MDQHLLLTFGTMFGGTRTIRINHVNPDISDFDVQNAMTGIIASGLLTSARGIVAMPRSASLVERTVSNIEL